MTDPTLTPEVYGPDHASPLGLAVAKARADSAAKREPCQVYTPLTGGREVHPNRAQFGPAWTVTWKGRAVACAHRRADAEVYAYGEIGIDELGRRNEAIEATDASAANCYGPEAK